ncbi:MAG: glycosyltransferase family 2 protein [Chloroflexi bacterium]|jgi:glycosyltransferase involved in cell wall biosynthesis|nr:glycosyltransferase family 2 protein [Chloroflexota bacterium]
MSPDTETISVIIPAYNESSGISQLIKEIKSELFEAGYSFEILVIDDGSTDDTVINAKQEHVTVIQHPHNLGNGAAIKTGIRNAKGEIIVMLDADGQHPPKDIPRLIEKIDKFDMVVGARTSASDTDMHRNFANSVYNALATYITGQKILDLTSGFRAIRTHIAKAYVYLLPNQFSYPTTITLATIRSGRSLTYVPIIGQRRKGKSNIRLFRDGIRFLLIILRIATFYSPLKIFIPVSTLMFITGFMYGLYKIIFLNLRYGPTSALLMTVSVVIFMVGLVSEQIAQLRFEQSEFHNSKN